MVQDPQGFAPFLACRLVALDKCPGVHSIGIGDTARCIVAKAVLAIIREDILDTAGTVQLCAGQIAGCEAAVHALRENFQHEDTKAALLVDGSCLGRTVIAKIDSTIFGPDISGYFWASRSPNSPGYVRISLFLVSG